MNNIQNKIPFVLYSLSGYDKCIGIVKIRNKDKENNNE